MKREWIISLVAMGVITFILAAAAAILLMRGAAPSIFGGKPQINIYVLAPPQADLGEEIQIKIMIENEGDSVFQVDEIRMPAQLTDAAVIEEVFPSIFPGQQEFYVDWTGYKIGMMLEPGERREFVIKLMPWQIADVASRMEIISKKKTYSTGFRILFNKKLVLEPTATQAPPTIPPTWTPQPLPPTDVPPTATSMALPYRSVVKIIAKVKHSSYLRNLWGGSGTILTPDGLILTNAHLVLPIPGARPDVFVIALTNDPAEEPVETYYAEPILTDEDLDLAILRIVSDLRYKPVDWKNLNLPAIKVGDSNLVELGDPLTILGYPGIGGDTITLTSGSVGGFTSQRAYGDRAYIKTSATISGGTSGGVVLNSKGEMIAVPTQLGPGGERDVVDCRVITDTNMDGEVDQRDACVPVGGFINALRPVNLALSMIQTAQQMIRATPTSEVISTPEK
ncbi:MAG: hypothetical protein B6D39_10680 [Anaerolineae bacterium UTCFX2]|jgi:hypothetical protein|nr:serine protease [Anaerolineales bacterium]OQY88744.1 MAG: hypothetical protein B6D39_10680 [Anaerolineae bacterium UTCFX2]